jgi:restriction system protein
MTVCRIRRNNAGERIAAILTGRSDPAAGLVGGATTDTLDDEGPSDDAVLINIAQVAHEQIQTHIQARFGGHNLARLVDAVLQAEGYVTRISLPGPDGGVDILAGMGSLGLDNPRLCVQVKATSRPVDVNVLRALQGTMQTFNANQGLLVSWGGFTGPLEREARQSFFTVRLWNAGDFLNAMYRSYERLPEEIQAELPLKRVWTLVLEEGEE